MAINRPSPLRAGDKAVIISPAGAIDSKCVHRARAVLHSWGLDVSIAPHALTEVGRFSGYVEQRLYDLQSALNNPDVKLIFCSRGGYGVIHLLDKLDLTAAKRYPKWLVGYSDITALHAALMADGIMSLHAPMAKHFANEGAADPAVRYTKKILAGQSVIYTLPLSPCSYLNRVGRVRGKLFGGNLSVLTGLLGTPYLKVPTNGILFIEDVGELPYKVDRMMNQLKLSGIFSKIKGLIVGQFTDYHEDARMYCSLQESIRNVVSDYDFPVCFDFPVGHVVRNFPMLIGSSAVLNVTDKHVLFKQ